MNIAAAAASLLPDNALDLTAALLRALKSYVVDDDALALCGRGLITQDLHAHTVRAKEVNPIVYDSGYVRLGER